MGEKFRAQISCSTVLGQYDKGRDYNYHVDFPSLYLAQSKDHREVVVRAVKRDSAGQPVHPQPNEDYFADSDLEPDSAESDEDDYDYEVVQKSGFLVEEDWSEND